MALSILTLTKLEGTVAFHNLGIESRAAFCTAAFPFNEYIFKYYVFSRYLYGLCILAVNVMSRRY